MKIGFFIKFDIVGTGVLDDIGVDCSRVVIGDEVLAVNLAKGLRSIDSDIECYFWSPDHIPNETMDIMIYMSEIKPPHRWARINILYIQTGLDTKTIEKLNTFHYDAHLCYSQNLIEKYKWSKALYLPFCIDREYYRPVEYSEFYDYEVAYIGGSQKRKDRIKKYLYPAVKFDLGLFGSWKLQRRLSFNLCSFIRRLLCFNIKRLFRELKELNDGHMSKLYDLCQGVVLQSDIPKIYSSSRIMLNFGDSKTVRDNSITLRTYEVLACKGFLISDKTPMAEELLKDCVVFTTGGKDLEDKIRYYLAHPEERMRIAENGYKWVMKHATLEMVAGKLYEFLMEITNKVDGGVKKIGLR